MYVYVCGRKCEKMEIHEAVARIIHERVEREREKKKKKNCAMRRQCPWNWRFQTRRQESATERIIIFTQYKLLLSKEHYVTCMHSMFLFVNSARNYVDKVSSIEISLVFNCII